MPKSPRTKTDREYEIERKWRERLLAGATSEDFQRAYDELHAWFLEEQGGHGEIYARVNPRGMDRSRLAVLREIGTGKRVLEVGSGDGLTSHLLARQGNSVVSVDVSTIALEKARARLGHEALDLRYEYGDARDLQFPDVCFDYVVSEHLVEHLSAEDFIKHLTEVHRVLKSGGSYLFFTPSRLWHGRKSVGFHLHVYLLAEIIPIVRRQGFAVTWLEPRFLPRWGLVIRLPGALLPPIFAYEYLLQAVKVHRWPEFLKARIIPSLMVRARKP
ncbi:MAG: hypothetical protein Kow00123_03350 [Anaerolineales bacterium]